MSRFLSAADVIEISQLLSEPRLLTFLRLVRSGAREDAIELHQATMSLGIAVMAVTGLLEVALRNAVCKHLDVVFLGVDWLRSPPSSLKWSSLEIAAIKKAQQQARRAVYSKMDSSDKAALDGLAFPAGKPLEIKHRKLAEKRQEKIVVSTGQVVAQLTMHFWKRLFSEHYEYLLWKRGLRKVFPDKSLSRPIVATHLEKLYETRNRLAHHEPVYGRRLQDALEAIDFVVRHLENRRPDVTSPLAKLILPQRDILSGQVAIMTSTFERLT